jgi:hypothetical protein
MQSVCTKYSQIVLLFCIALVLNVLLAMLFGALFHASFSIASKHIDHSKKLTDKIRRWDRPRRKI